MTCDLVSGNRLRRSLTDQENDSEAVYQSAAITMPILTGIRPPERLRNSSYRKSMQATACMLLCIIYFRQVLNPRSG